MSFKVLIFSFGAWHPATTKYFTNLESAEQYMARIVTERLGGNAFLAQVVEVGKREPESPFFMPIK